MVLLLDWASLISHFVIGTTFAWIAYFLTTATPQLSFGSLAHLPILVFAIVLGAASNYASLMVRVEQERAMVSTAGSIAHELRTPLLSISAGATGLRDYLPGLIEGYDLAMTNGLPVPPIRSVHFESMKNVLDRIETEAAHSNAIIDMLLVNARQTSRQQPELTVCSIQSCIETALRRYPFTEAERKLVNLDIGNDFSFLGNELLTVHILFNLIKNALRHIAMTGKGAISIRYELSSQWNRLIFRDSGSGIPPEALPHIFSRFYTSANDGDSILGAGIGLAFCRDVISSFGGSIECSSIPNEFTEFVLQFPTP
jgi:two-component system CAI-1 autoinducer sensor kinase/phosphatase CqsS